MTIQYDLKEQERVYERWAKFYDTMYLKMLAPSQRRVAEAASASGPRIRAAVLRGGHRGGGCGSLRAHAAQGAGKGA